jgi:hypothetical protein
MENKRTLRYYIPPLVNLPYVTEYKDVNKNKSLRYNITDFFLTKTIKWINNYKSFSHLKNKLPILESEKGYNIIYNLLREFIKKGENNWFDLRENYKIIKDFLRYKLGK